MHSVEQASISNRLLKFLPIDDFAVVSGHLEFVELPRRTVLSKPYRASEFVFFLESGLGSLVASSPQGQNVEIDIFGRGGFSPTAAALESGSDPFSCLMQIAGSAYRLHRKDFSRFLAESSFFRTMVKHYVQVSFVQAAYTALSNAAYQIDQRLARYILMCHDRMDGDEIAITHEFLSTMLAVRRSSVTDALHVLEGKHLVRTERALVIVRNRPTLEAFAHNIYGVPESEYLRLIGKMR